MHRKQHRSKPKALKATSKTERATKRDKAVETAENESRLPSPTNPEFALTSPPLPEDYADYVEHPRFGKAPRYTGLDPNPDYPGVHLHYNTSYHTEGQRRAWKRLLTEAQSKYGRSFSSSPLDRIPELVPGTAVAADLARQTYAYFPVSHYYDIDSTCQECGRKFIFFAEEQKHWYEELGFPLEAQAARCSPCRKRLQNIARMRRRFEQLLALPSRSGEETLELADCCMSLIEAEIFHPHQCERIRMLLKRVPEERRSEERFRDVTARLHTAESKFRRRNTEEASA